MNAFENSGSLCPSQRAIHGICQIACHLLHPGLAWSDGYPVNIDRPALEFDVAGNIGHQGDEHANRLSQAHALRLPRAQPALDCTPLTCCLP